MRGRQPRVDPVGGRGCRFPQMIPEDREQQFRKLSLAIISVLCLPNSLCFSRYIRERCIPLQKPALMFRRLRSRFLRQHAFRRLFAGGVQSYGARSFLQISISEAELITKQSPGPMKQHLSAAMAAAGKSNSRTNSSFMVISLSGFWVEGWCYVAFSRLFRRSGQAALMKTGAGAVLIPAITEFVKVYGMSLSLTSHRYILKAVVSIMRTPHTGQVRGCIWHLRHSTLTPAA